MRKAMHLQDLADFHWLIVCQFCMSRLLMRHTTRRWVEKFTVYICIQDASISRWSVFFLSQWSVELLFVNHCNIFLCNIGSHPLFRYNSLRHVCGPQNFFWGCIGTECYTALRSRACPSALDATLNRARLNMPQMNKCQETDRNRPVRSETLSTINRGLHSKCARVNETGRFWQQDALNCLVWCSYFQTNAIWF